MGVNVNVNSQNPGLWNLAENQYTARSLEQQKKQQTMAAIMEVAKAMQQQQQFQQQQELQKQQLAQQAGQQSAENQLGMLKLGYTPSRQPTSSVPPGMYAELGGQGYRKTNAIQQIPLFTFNEQGGLQQVASIPKGSRVVPPAQMQTPGEKLQGELAKQAAPKIKENEILAGQAGNLKDLYVRARQELSTVQNIGKPGLEGRMAGLIGKGKSVIGISPLANTYNARRLGFATTIAKAAGEVRPTDADIRRFLKGLPDLAASDEENANRIAEMEKDLTSKNPQQIWRERTSINTGKLSSGITYTVE